MQRQLDELSHNIKQAQNLLKVAEELLEQLRSEVTSRGRHAARRPSNKPGQEMLTPVEAQRRWQAVRGAGASKDFADVYETQVKSLTSDNLGLFIRYNHIPVSSKRSKESVTQAILQVLRAEAAIEGRYIGGGQKAES